ncbi:MAG: hypothetical protein O7F71_22020 [Gammaproteobacteria bacterium]|nr:hypothetical protein [Gammaproteobacteria bacterium]
MKYTMTLASACSAICLVFGAPVFADEEEEEPFFEEAFLFFELNNTDGDLGIHAKIDGDPWKRLKIVCESDDDHHKTLLKIRAKNSLRKQGLTEIFFESAEPVFDELSPEEFFERFPEGDCVIKGTTVDGEKVATETSITHLMPAPPVITAPAAANCDAEDLPEVSASMPITISWEEVVSSHPDLGSSGDIEIVNYQVVVEIDEEPFHVSAILPPDVTSFVIPPEMIALMGAMGGDFGDELKFEVLVREASYNQTAVESCFEVIP